MPPTTVQTKLAAASTSENVPVTTAATANLKQDERGAVVDEALALDDRERAARHAEPATDRRRRERIGRRDDRAEDERRRPTEGRSRSARPTATETVVAATSPTASSEIGRRFRRSSRSPVLYAAE